MTIPFPDGQRIFRLAYSSRAAAGLQRREVVTLAAQSETKNRRNGVSGVLISSKDTFLQWLEGPADDVCALMARITADPRHRDISVLSAGWMPTRRFPGWPMRLAEPPVQDDSLPGAVLGPRGGALDVDQAMIAFEHAAHGHRRRMRRDLNGGGTPVSLAEQLVRCGSDSLPNLPPPARKDLRTRAQLVDEVCAAFAKGWQDEVWSTAEIAVGLGHLNCLWQRLGRSPLPLRDQGSVAIVVPPGNFEILGAVVKADLLRAAGMSVQLVLEGDIEATLATLSRTDPASIVIAGPRVGLASDADRTAELAHRIKARIPDRPVHVGGRAGGALCDWPARLGFRRDATGPLPASDVEWLALSVMAWMARDGRSLA
ncbi:hypothetical protein roselon_02170 [Roseibacterium elongatum DSM 19469]|uniref:BLUF domain-containing protein n=1 Tax=Roseicyclus elongatus DSM 19469 TaxID=1294273 RepID=W8SPS1_9RHOB|nr:hypothetical protein roselon_02170 [Roseibacterium elongatum DSM 19469]